MKSLNDAQEPKFKAGIFSHAVLVVKIPEVPIPVRKSMPLLDGRISKVTCFTKCLPSMRDSRPSQRTSHFSKTQIGPWIRDIF
jgi:hypothetical protein